MILLQAYHGTRADLVETILKNGFNPSIGDDHWLGDGTYFFVDGITGSDPKDAAEKWAVAQAYDKAQNRNLYQRYAVLGCLIEVDEEKVLDLTSREGMLIFNKLRNRFMQKIATSDYKPSKGTHFMDGHIINLARTEIKMPFYFVKGDFYIKFRIERINYINFRIPNCTILAVINVNPNIHSGSLSCVLERKIDDYEF